MWRTRSAQARMFERLTGMIVVLTREPPDNAALVPRLRDRAAAIVELPCIRTESLTDSRDLAEALASLTPDDWLVVTSRHGADAVGRWGSTLARIAAVGEATAVRLRAHGLSVAFQPTAQSGEVLARELPPRSGVVLLARSDRALPDLPAILRERGFRVREVVAYRTLAAASGDVDGVRGLLETSGHSVALLFHSPSAIEGMLGVIDASLIARASVFVAGHSTERAVRARLGPSVNVAFIEEEVAGVARR